MTYLGSKNPPTSADSIVGTTTGNAFAGTPVELARVTVDRTGLWTAAAYMQTINGTESGGAQTTCELRYGGTVVVAVPLSIPSGMSPGGGVTAAPTHLASGQIISFYCYKNGSTTANVQAQQLRATFVPTAAFPQ